jgi:hypothetical protein
LTASKRIFLTAEWRNLAMLNYAVDPPLIGHLVPPGVELDSFEGKTYVSLVGFMFLRTRVLGRRVPFHQDFEEVNLRFYVRREVSSGMRRGVVFIREIVPRRAVAAVARLVFNENYVCLPMFHKIDSTKAEYGWQCNRHWNSIAVETDGRGAFPESGSAEQFITEHYWGYSRQTDRGCLEYEVRHEPWRVWTAHDARFEGDAAPLYGPELARVLTATPDSAFLADGSAVRVFRGERIC